MHLILKNYKYDMLTVKIYCNQAAGAHNGSVFNLWSASNNCSRANLKSSFTIISSNQ